MTEEDRIAEIHDFLFGKPITGGPSRAEQIETVLKGARSAGLLARAVLWVSGFVTAISAAWIVITGGK